MSPEVAQLIAALIENQGVLFLLVVLLVVIYASPLVAFVYLFSQFNGALQRIVETLNDLKDEVASLRTSVDNHERL